MIVCCYAECDLQAVYAECDLQAVYAECRYVEFHCAECRGAS